MNNGELRRQAKAAAKQYDQAWLPLARALYQVKKLKAYEDWGFELWSEYIAEDLEISIELRQADYFCLVIAKLQVGLGVSDMDLEAIGPSRARAIIPVVDKSNIDKWMVVAKKTPYKDLEDAVRSAKKKGDKTPPEISNYVPLNFRVTTDQATTIRHALGLVGKVAPNPNKSDGHLMELMALDFIANHPTSSKEYFAQQCNRLEQVFGIKLVAIDKENPAWPAMLEKIRGILSGAEIDIQK
jgi:hypothetical protein